LIYGRENGLAPWSLFQSVVQPTLLYATRPPTWSTNMSIFDILKKANIFPRVRDADPLTSAQAADQAGKLSVMHGELIVQALVAYGPMGKDQIAEVTYLDGNQVARRMKELQTLGMVELTGRTVKNKSGRQEREWAATMCA
jgi:hypothetical protein